jgi:hypothetical protein
VIRESYLPLDNRAVAYPNWRCNECDFVFQKADLRDRHEATRE